MLERLDRVASCRRAISSSVRLRVSFIGDSLRGVQNLVGVRVADAAEDVRIGERALQRVVLARQALGELRQRRAEHLEPARIERGQSAAPLRPGGSTPAASAPASVRIAVPGRKIERREPDLAGDRGAALAPAQPPGDHQVQHEEEIALHREDDPLAHASKRDHAPPFERADRRLGRADDEGIADPQALEWLLQHAGR